MFLEKQHSTQLLNAAQSEAVWKLALRFKDTQTLLDGQIRTPRHGDPMVLRQCSSDLCMVPCRAPRTDTPKDKLTLNKRQCQTLPSLDSCHPTPTTLKPRRMRASPQGCQGQSPWTVTAHRRQQGWSSEKRLRRHNVLSFRIYQLLTRRNSSHQRDFTTQYGVVFSQNLCCRKMFHGNANVSGCTLISYFLKHV